MTPSPTAAPSGPRQRTANSGDPWGHAHHLRRERHDAVLLAPRATTPRPGPRGPGRRERQRPRRRSGRPPATPGQLEDATLAAYLAELHDQGRAPASAATAGDAACFRARLAGRPTPAGERTARVLAGYRRTAGSRGRGQARPFGAADLAAVLATCHQPRRRGRGRETDQVALERGRLDAVIAGLLFMAGMRRSEVSALRWADVADAADGDGVLVTVRRGKTNQEGETRDVRFGRPRRGWPRRGWSWRGRPGRPPNAGRWRGTSEQSGNFRYGSAVT